MTTLAPAGLETRDTADLEVCATLNRYVAPLSPPLYFAVMPKTRKFPLDRAALNG
jgi:hypothetical protein